MHDCIRWFKCKLKPPNKNECSNIHSCTPPTWRVTPGISVVIVVPPKTWPFTPFYTVHSLLYPPPIWPVTPGISAVIAVPPPNMALHPILYSMFIAIPTPPTRPVTPGISVLYIHKKVPVDPWPQNFEIVWLSGNTFLLHKSLVQVTN